MARLDRSFRTDAEELALTLLYRDDVFSLHDTGQHPERIERLRSINGILEKTGLASLCTPGSFAPLPEEVITAVHDPAMVERAKRMAAEGGGYLDPDTVVC